MRTRYKTSLAKTVLWLFAISTMTVMSGCNPARSAAKKRAMTFTKTYLADSKMSDKHFGRLDSTYQVNDSLLALFRQHSQENGLFKGNVSFDNGEFTRPVYFLGLTYKDSRGEEHHLTFYYDKTLDNLLAVKGY